MPYPLTGRHTMLNALANAISGVSLWNGDPTTTGIEIAGGAPAYARKTITWKEAAAGAKNATDDAAGRPVFDVPSGANVTHVAFTNIAGGIEAYGILATARNYTSQGTFTLDDADLSLTVGS